MPGPGVSVIADSMSAKVSLPCARAPSTACCWVIPAGNCLLTTPSKMMLVALPSSFGPITVKTTLITPSSDDRDQPEAFGTHPAEQSARRWAEVQRLLGGHADAAAERAASAGTAAGRRRELGPFRGGRLGGWFRHADTSAASWDCTISTKVGQVSSSSACRADPDDQPVLQHDDLVGVGDGRHPLRDDDHRLVPGGRLQRRSQPGVGGQVQRRERIVEQVDRSVARPAPGRSPAVAVGRPRRWNRPG